MGLPDVGDENGLPIIDDEDWFDATPILDDDPWWYEGLENL